jgi:hypothetical protein
MWWAAVLAGSVLAVLPLLACGSAEEASPSASTAGAGRGTTATPSRVLTATPQIQAEPYIQEGRWDFDWRVQQDDCGLLPDGKSQSSYTFQEVVSDDGNIANGEQVHVYGHNQDGTTSDIGIRPFTFPIFDFVWDFAPDYPVHHVTTFTSADSAYAWQQEVISVNGVSCTLVVVTSNYPSADSSPEAGPVAYLAAVSDLQGDLETALAPLLGMDTVPGADDADWSRRLSSAAQQLHQLYERARDIDVPPGWGAVHEEELRAYAEVDAMAGALEQAATTRRQADLDRATEHLNSAASHFLRAGELTSAVQSLGTPSE